MNGLQTFWKTYFDFHYGIGLVIGLIVFVSYLFIISKDKRKRGGKISGREVFLCLALSAYIVFLLGVTILSRTWISGRDVRLELFWSYRLLFETTSRWTAKQMIKQIALNVLAFVPWGILAPLCFGDSFRFSKVAGSAFLMSAGIELVQLIGQCGLCELDDVVHNTLGAMIGYALLKCGRLWLEKFSRQRKMH